MKWYGFDSPQALDFPFERQNLLKDKICNNLNPYIFSGQYKMHSQGFKKSASYVKKGAIYVQKGLNMVQLA